MGQINREELKDAPNSLEEFRKKIENPLNKVLSEYQKHDAHPALKDGVWESARAVRDLQSLSAIENANSEHSRRLDPRNFQFLMALKNETFLTCSGSDRRPKRQKLSVSERLETRRVSQLRGLLSSRVVKDGASLRGAVSVGPRHETFFAQQKQTSKETLVSLRNFCTKLSKEASLFKHEFYSPRHHLLAA